MFRIRCCLLHAALLSSAAAVEIRVATFNIGAHFNQTFFDYSLGDPGTSDHESVKRVLARIDADVVALQEVHSVDLQGNPDDLDALAASLGYPHLFVTPHVSAFDSSLKVVILSRFPFLSTGQVESPAGAKELTRNHPVVKVDVPGTPNDLTVYSLHLKAGTLLSDRFRRAVEMKRLVGHLAASGLTGDDNFIILGDFNPSAINATFSSQPADLPGTYVLGSDVTFPVSYSTNPLAYFSAPMPARLDPRHLNGSDSTFDTTDTNGPTLDLMLVSPAIAGRPHDSEVFNSTLDVSNSTGLPKAGAPLADGTSALASDHYAVFVDMELDSDLPNLDVALSASQLAEGSGGSVSATVTLPAPRPGAVTVALAADDSTVTVSPASQAIAAGQTSAVFQISAPRNFVVDGTRTVAFGASASGYDPDSAVLQLSDADAPYAFTAAGQFLIENFNGFQGGGNPGSWSVTPAVSWLGTDDGSSPAPGWRAYGSGSERAPGWVPSGSASVLAADFLNSTGTVLDTLRVSVDVEHWRSALNGAADRLGAELVTGTRVIPLTGLSFTAPTNRPSGPQAGGSPLTLVANAGGLGIAPGASFSLRFTFTPGSTSGALPSDVFVNEFHYDNASTDVGEFVELAVGPGYSGPLSEVTLLVYNGSNGQTIGTHTLDTFVAGSTTVTGHRLFSKAIVGLQNDSEGFAVVVGGVLRQFISYKGSFTATNGAASGMTAVNVGVTQSGSDPVGTAALGLKGTGSVADNFTWFKFSGVAHSPGQPNQDQVFILPSLPPQGLAIDNVSVGFILDSDGDGLADVADADDDNDGMTDREEQAFGSDPWSASSRFTTTLGRALSAPFSRHLSFSGKTGVTYTLEASADLRTWSGISQHAGTNGLMIVPLPEAGAARFYRISAPVP